MDNQKVTLAGWVHEVRKLKNVTFLLLRDITGIIQVTGKAGTCDKNIIESMDIPKESVISVEGIVKINPEAKIGFEIIPTKITNLNPISKVIPFETTGKVPAELDTRLDYRYIDLRRLQTEAIFKIESTILNSFRNFLYNKGFNEIRTSSIVAEATEGGADLFPLQYFEEKAYLAQSPQLYKQMAVIGGLDKVFMIMPVYRAEKSNDLYHLNEITQMDVEIGFSDYNDAEKLLKDTLEFIISEVVRRNDSDLKVLGIELKVPETKVIEYAEVVKKLKEKGESIEFGDDFSREHEKAIEKYFGESVLVTEFPTKVRAFYSMPNENNKELSHSYDLIYKGMEISSGAQRIHIADMLVDAIKERGMDPNNFKSYVDAFRCGAPPHAGWSIGLERLAMQITGMKNIRECAMFPRDRKRISP